MQTQPIRAAGAPPPRGKVLQSSTTISGFKTQQQRYQSFHGGTSVVNRRMFPNIDYMPRGAPKRNEVKITPFGYELNMVPEYGKGGIGLQRQSLVQQPRPRAPHPRTRFDAYLICPQRSLSIKQIMAGEYFSRPDPEAFQRILNAQHLSASRIVVSGSSRATTAPGGARRPAGSNRQLPSASPSMPALHLSAPAAATVPDLGGDTRGLSTSMSAPSLGHLTRTVEA